MNWLIVMLAILAFALGYFCGLERGLRYVRKQATHGVLTITKKRDSDTQ